MKGLVLAEAVLTSAVASITIPEDSDIVSLSGTTTLTSILVGPDKWGARKIVLSQTSGATTLTNTNSPTAAGQMNLRGANVTLRAGDSIELFVKSDGTLLRTGGGPVTGEGLWANAPIMAALLDPNLAYMGGSDFIGDPVDDTTGIPTGWAVVADAGSTLGQKLVDAPGGIFGVSPDGDDNDEAYASSTNEAFKFAADKPMWFECRAKLKENGGTAGKSGFILGVSDNVGANSLTDGTDDGTIMASFDGACFFKKEGGTNIEFCGSNAATQDKDDTGTAFADDTWYRLGFYFDPGAGTTGTLTPYVNGVALTPQNITLSGLEEMHILFGSKQWATTGECALQIDWYRYLQIR